MIPHSKSDLMKQKLGSTNDGSTKKIMNVPAETDVNRLNIEVKTVSETTPTRIYFIDNLKILLAVLVVLHHAAQPYALVAAGGYLQNQQV
jgi:hypothetical protein